MLMKGIITFISNSIQKYKSTYYVTWMVLGNWVQLYQSWLQWIGYKHHPYYYVSPSHMWDRHIEKGCIYVMKETTFPPKGKLPQFSSYLNSYQIISWLKQGAKHKTLFFKCENFNGIDSYGNSTLWKSCLIISLCHAEKAISWGRYACKNIACKELKDSPKLDEELRDSN